MLTKGYKNRTLNFLTNNLPARCPIILDKSSESIFCITQEIVADPFGWSSKVIKDSQVMMELQCSWSFSSSEESENVKTPLSIVFSSTSGEGYDAGVDATLDALDEAREGSWVNGEVNSDMRDKSAERKTKVCDWND